MSDVVLAELRALVSPEVRANEPLAPHTTFKIGGPAEFFLAAKTADDAALAARVAHELDIPLFVFGGGSNMLVSDAGVRGLVVMMANRDFRIDGETVIAEAGAPTGLVSMRAAEAGLTGFEWAVGVPGTIGGAVRGNAGAYGGDMAEGITDVRALVPIIYGGAGRPGADQDMTTGGYEERTLSNAECAFAYRESVFKRTPGMIVLSATIRLARASDPAATKARLKQILLDRREKQPVEYPTAGCMFKNWEPPIGTDMVVLAKLLDLGSGESVQLTPQGTVPAGWLVDRAGLKGFAVGHVRISEKHGNFFVTDGKASADEVVQLTAAIKTKIRNLSGGVVQLREEVEYVGF